MLNCDNLREAIYILGEIIHGKNTSIDIDAVCLIYEQEMNIDYDISIQLFFHANAFIDLCDTNTLFASKANSLFEDNEFIQIFVSNSLIRDKNRMLKFDEKIIFHLFH